MLCLIFLAALVPPATAAAASAEMFPGLRKRKLAVLQKQAEIVHAPMPEGAAVPAAVPAEVPEEVPSVVDAAADGFPQLPGVSQMLSAASGTMKAVSSQASGLEARVVQAQMQIEAKMAKQKAAFEEKLKLQEQGNQKVIEANGNINAEIKKLQSGNAALRKHAHEIEQSNRLMRKELNALESHLAVAKDFTSKSLTATDDSKNALLQVLKKDSNHHALVEMTSHSKKDDDDDDDDDEDSDDDEAATSFLQVSPDEFGFAAPEGPSLDAGAGASLDAAGAPGDLLAVLAKDVANLAQHQKSSEKNLKNLFIRDFRAGIKRNKVLLAKQKSLISTRTSLLSLQAQLKSAEAHVDATRAQLEARLHGLGQYLQKLAHFAMAPQHEVPHLLQVLPKAVTVKAGKVVKH